MSNFDDAVKVVFIHEGGWVSNPADPGGETNFGISTLIIEREGITNEQLGLPPGREPGWLKNLSVDAAKWVYRTLFWDKYGYGAIIDQTVATKVFDAGVNIGPMRAHVRAQKVAGAVQDGVLGPHSFAAINSVPGHDFVVAYAAELTKYYTDLVAAKPSLGVFLHNWLHRAQWGV